MDMSDVYDTVNHRLLIWKHNTTKHCALCKVIQNMFSNRILYVDLNNERSRWIRQNNGLPQGSVLSLTLPNSTYLHINISTNDQPVHYGTRSFIDVDNMCITAHYPTFSQAEIIIEQVPDEFTEYYRNNILRTNPDKTKVSAFHIRNGEVKRTLNVSWNGVDLHNTVHVTYVGATVYRTLR